MNSLCFLEQLQLLAQGPKSWGQIIRGIGNCETCSNWVKYTDMERGPPFPSAKMEGGICTSKKFVEDCDYALDMLVYSYDEGGKFWTGPKFGCVHWIGT